MDEKDLKFNSDSTYCSIYENLSKSRVKKCRTSRRESDSEFLDKAHNDVLLHLEGTKLLGRIQILHYMNRIAKMTLRRPRDKYYSQKINNSLIKLLNVTRQFERSFSQLSIVSDPIIVKKYTTSSDTKITSNGIPDDPKQILLQSSSVDTTHSFPLQLLTNVNFVSPDFDQFKSSSNPCANYMDDKMYAKPKNSNTEDSSKDIFFAQNSEGSNSGILKQYQISLNENSAQSFPLELLTNNNFINSSSSQIFGPPPNNCKNQLQATLDEEIIINDNKENTNLFSSGSSEVYIGDNLGTTAKGHGYSVKSSYQCVEISDTNNAFSTKTYVSSSIGGRLHTNTEDPFQSSQKNSQTNDKSEENNILPQVVNNSRSAGIPVKDSFVLSPCEDHVFTQPGPLKNQNTSNRIYFEGMSDTIISGSEIEVSQLSGCDNLQQKSNITNITDASIESELNNIMLRAIHIGENQINPYNSNINIVVCKTFIDQNGASLPSIVQLGKEFERMVKWQEIQKDLQQCERLANDVCSSVDTLFKKLSIQEVVNRQIEYKEKLHKDLHNFTEEKLDLINLIKKNEVKLENISHEMRVLLSSRSFESENTGDEDLDWRKLIV